MDNRTIEEVRKNETKLINEIKELEQQVKKQKETVDKANKYLCRLLHEAYLGGGSNIDIALIEYAVDILKEGKNE